MKFLIKILLLVAICYAPQINAQSNKNIIVDTLEVKGNCNACKTRIEDAADIKGVRKVKWDKHSNQLYVTYDKRKTSLEAISEAIAESGHDTNLNTANHDVYHKLPSCCAYRAEDAHIH